MNYIQDLADRLALKLPGLPDELLDIYVLLVLTTGVNTTLENVHDAWSAWTNSMNPEHRSLVPFSELSLAVQELDRMYANGIVDLALEIYGK